MPHWSPVKTASVKNWIVAKSPVRPVIGLNQRLGLLGKVLSDWLAFSQIRIAREMPPQEWRSRMKKTDIEQENLWPTAEQLEKAREELRNRITDAELECTRREAVNGLSIHLKVDAESLRRFWIRPLIEAGATMDMALASIAQSCFQPN